jgi:cellulose synthase/poly-beta-1,6-N-acetylglucosamine synthase-like glycosyltransferase
LILEVLEFFFLFLTAIMISYLFRHYIFTISVLRSLKKSHFERQTSLYQPTVSILIPASNEEKVIGRLLQRITNFTYPKEKLQVIVIDDASNDRTGEIVDDYKQKYPFVDVVHRSADVGRKGKASAMNHGFKSVKNDIVLCFDADYYPQNDIVEKLIQVFDDPKVGAVQGRVVVLNEPQNFVTRIVALERTGGYRVDQEARNMLDLITQFGGTVGGFRRSVLLDLGGWDEFVLAEDTDLTFRVYLAGYKIRYCVNAECYEEAVDNWKSYWHQRYRWAKGHMQCFFKHSVSVMKSKKLSAKEKLDGLMLLGVYFMPILVLLSIFVGVPLIFQDLLIVEVSWIAIPISLYCFVGNFAPFFEVGAGLYLDGRTRTQWLIPLLLFTFLFNIPICVKAFFSVIYSRFLRKNRHVWVKTTHSGSGNCYIGSPSLTSVDKK